MRKNKQVTAQLASLWNEVTENLTLRQFEKCMGGDMSYKSKALRALDLSKSIQVQCLCLDMIQLYESHFEIAETSVNALNIDLADFE